MKDKISWTDDRIALLKRMWKEGKSAAEIAKAVGRGVTRNAVIGKAHRMGLSGRPSPIKKESPAPASKKVAPSAAAVVGKKGKAKAVPAAPPPKPVKVQKQAFKPGMARPVEEPVKFEKEAVPPGGGVALLDLTERMCKWPIGDPRDADFTFCGLAIRPGTPYCPQHAAVAYQTSSRRGMAAVAVVAVDEEKEEEVVDDDAVVEEDEADEDVVATEV